LIAATLALKYFDLFDGIMVVRFEKLENDIGKNRALAFATQKRRLPPPKK
jgi:hypothetical protein